MKLHYCDTNKDCLAACVATLLGLEAVPDICVPDNPDCWIPALDAYLQPWWLYFLMISDPERRCAEAIRGLHLIMGATARGQHAVVGWRGVVLHDPSRTPLPMDSSTLCYGFLIPTHVLGRPAQAVVDHRVEVALSTCPEEYATDVEIYHFMGHVTDRLREAALTEQVQKVMLAIYGKVPTL